MSFPEPIVLGVDEAGRGPAIGPLIIAGVAVPESVLVKFENLGIRDSKRLSPKRREQLYDALQQLNAKIYIRELTATKIDLTLKDTQDNLNLLEIRVMADIINEAMPTIAYIDAISKPAYSERHLDPLLSSPKPRLVVENKADDNYAVVGAASIIAKVLRDQNITALQEAHRHLGDFGSGYPADPKTQRFLERNVDTIRRYQLPFVRMEWECTKRILRRKRQTLI